MERSSAIRTGAYMGAALAGAIIVSADVRSSAYLPIPLAVCLAAQPFWMAAAASAAFGVPFLVSVLAGLK